MNYIKTTKNYRFCLFITLMHTEYGNSNCSSLRKDNLQGFLFIFFTSTWLANKIQYLFFHRLSNSFVYQCRPPKNKIYRFLYQIQIVQLQCRSRSKIKNKRKISHLKTIIMYATIRINKLWCNKRKLNYPLSLLI